MEAIKCVVHINGFFKKQNIVVGHFLVCDVNLGTRDTYIPGRNKGKIFFKSIEIKFSGGEGVSLDFLKISPIDVEWKFYAGNIEQLTTFNGVGLGEVKLRFALYVVITEDI